MRQHHGRGALSSGDMRLKEAVQHTPLESGTLNVNGFRSPQKEIALGSFLARRNPGVLQLTATHLRADEAGALCYPPYEVVDPDCREMEGLRGRVGGGTLILARAHLHHEMLPNRPKPAAPIHASMGLAKYLVCLCHRSLRVFVRRPIFMC